MSTFKRFEDIKAWQKAREVTRQIYQISSDEKFFRDYGLRDQIRRSAVSIMANIAEGYGRKTNKDFANFLVIAHASTSETQSHLYIALDLNYITQEQFTEIYGKLDETSKMTMALCTHLLKSS